MPDLDFFLNDDSTFGFNPRDFSRMVNPLDGVFFKALFDLDGGSTRSQINTMRNAVQGKFPDGRRRGKAANVNNLLHVRNVNGDEYYLPVLTVAVMAGVDVEKIMALLDMGAKLHFKKDLALQYAIITLKPGIVQAIIDFGIQDPNAANMELRALAEDFIANQNAFIPSSHLDADMVRVVEYINSMMSEDNENVQQTRPQERAENQGNEWFNLFGVPHMQGRTDFFNLPDVPRMQAQADAEAAAEHRKMVSQDASRYGSVEAQNQNCSSFSEHNGRRYFKDIILDAYQPLDANRIIRLVSVDHERKKEPRYFCFDAVVLHDFLKHQKEAGRVMRNPIDNSLIFRQDFDKIAAKAKSLNYEYPDDLSDDEEEAVAALDA